jgi:adenylosuccinate synthase
MDIAQFEQVEPIYAELPGWKESTCGAKSLDSLPVNAKRYIEFIEEAAEVSVDIISTGPDREETIVLRHPFEKN